MTSPAARTSARPQRRAPRGPPATTSSSSSQPDGPVVIDDMTLDVRPGEFVCLVGASGCGKSTLLNIIAGSTGRPRARSRPPGRPSFMFQEAALFPGSPRARTSSSP